jgi:hypothetical protein
MRLPQLAISTVPAHLRHRATAQTVVNDVESPGTCAMSRAETLPNATPVHRGLCEKEIRVAPL